MVLQYMQINSGRQPVGGKTGAVDIFLFNIFPFRWAIESQWVYNRHFKISHECAKKLRKFRGKYGL